MPKQLLRFLGFTQNLYNLSLMKGTYVGYLLTAKRQSLSWPKIEGSFKLLSQVESSQAQQRGAIITVRVRAAHNVCVCVCVEGRQEERDS